MKNKLLISSLILTFLLFANLLFGQTNMQKDSLLKVIPTLKDTAKLKAVYSIIKITKIDASGKQYLDMLLAESRAQKNIQYEELSLAMLMEWHFPKYENDSLFIIGEETILFARKHKINKLLFFAYQSMIQRHANQDKYIRALSIAEEAYAEAKMLQDNESIARIATAMGITYSHLKQDSTALFFFKESINHIRRAKQLDSWLIVNNYNYMGSSACGTDQYEKVLQYTDSMRYYLNTKDKTEQTTQLYYYYAEAQTAIAHSYLKHPKLAFEAIMRAEKLYSPQWNHSAISLLDEAYTAYYRNIGDHKKSLEYINKVIDRTEEDGQKSGLLTQLNRKAYALFELKEYKDASIIYRDMNNIKDSLNQSQFYSQINELRTIYNLDKAEMQVKQHELSIQAQRNMIAGLIVSSLLFLIIGILIYIYSRQLRAKNHILYKQIQEQDKLEEEIEEKNTYIYQNSTNSELIRNGKLFAALKELMKDETIYTQTDIDRKAIAEMLNTNEKYLFDSIKENAGLPFSEYINGLRLNLAKKLLSDNNNFTIEDIAIRSGFGSRTTFHRQFREKYQLSPAEFRKVALTEKQKS